MLNEQAIERIKELSVKTGFFNVYEDGEISFNNEYGMTEELSGFAELVVHECIDHIMNSSDKHRKEYFAGLLKENFLKSA